MTNLGGLATSLTLRERGGSDLLAGLGRLSLRKEDQQGVQAKRSSLNSNESRSWHLCARRISSQVFTCSTPVKVDEQAEYRQSKSREATTAASIAREAHLTHKTVAIRVQVCCFMYSPSWICGLVARGLKSKVRDGDEGWFSKGRKGTKRFWC